MQVAVETLTQLERKLKVTVPAEQIEEAVSKRLQELSRTAKIDGYRPGKVPFALINKHYEPGVRHEVIDKAINENLRNALNQENLMPAGYPEIVSLAADKGNPLTFEATFEVYPEIKLADMQGVSLEKPVAEITEEDVNHLLDKMRQQRSTWASIERAAQTGDQLVIDFTGTIDGKEFAGGKAEGITVVLGSGRMIPGFEEGLVGLAKDQRHILKVTFPKDYGAEELADKAAEFAITVHEVKEPVLPELDEAFAKSFGVTEGGIEQLRQEVRQNLERQFKRTLRERLKQQVMDKLLALNPIDVPQALVKAEIENLRKQMQEWMKPYMKNSSAPNLPDEEFQERAQRRVSLGLLLAEFVKQHDLQPAAEKVKLLIEEEASAYEHPHAVEEFYYKNRERLAQMESLALEEQAVDLIIAQAKITEKPVSYAELTEHKH